MISNYFTLRHLAADLQNRSAGRAIETAFTQSRNELILSIEGDISLIVSCEPSSNALYLRSRVSRARRNSSDCFVQLHGSSIRSVKIQDADREIVIDLTEAASEPGLSLVVQFFGSKANVYLARNRSVIDAFLQPRQHTGTVLDPPHVPRSPRSQEELDAALRSIGQVTVGAVLKTMFPLFGSLLLREVLHRAQIPEPTPAAAIGPPDLTRLYQEIAGLMNELSRPPSPRVYREGGRPVYFSILNLHLAHDLPFDEYDSLHEGIRAFLAETRRQKGSSREQSELRARLESEISRTERTLGALAKEMSAVERASEYELFGKLLLAIPQAVSKGMKTVVLENVFSPDRKPVEISLDPHLTGPKNAQRFFDRARKARTALTEAAARKQRYDERYHRLKTIANTLSGVHTPDQWDEFVHSMKADLVEEGLIKKSASGQKELPPFRIFIVEGGFQVWAGKSSENNDLLTLKHARPNDLWFHARGSGGAHVVLRAGSGKGEISRKAIEQAASIAAYYSKMKTSGLVPVAMTLRKHVRKPRGAPAGTVAIEREKVLMVVPHLPESKQQ
ncbi:MAG: NFACT family protein [Ignavibacteriales bacterium]|nr:NFACT family protein [Ignavibacteriales bacterium]